MLKSKAEYNKVINRFYEKIGCNLKPIFKLNVWFIIKIQLSYQLNLGIVKGSIQDIKSYKPKYLRIIKSKSHYFSAFKSLMSLFPKLIYFKYIVRFSKKDVLFLGYLSNNRDINNESQNIYLYPFIQEHLSEKMLLYYLDSNKNKELPFQYLNLLISWYKLVYNLKFSLSKNKVEILYGYGNILNGFLKEEINHSIIGLDKFLADQIVQYLIHRAAYKQLLGKLRPSTVLGYCFYDNRINAMFGAAELLNIKTVEYQHSAMSNLHFAYSKWNKIDEIAIHFPSDFYVWNKRDKKLLETNFNGSFYKPNVTIKGLRHLKTDSLLPKNKKNKLLICLQGIWMPDWLENFIRSDNHYQWYIRLHPRYPNDKKQLEQLEMLQKPNIYIEEANSTTIENIILQSEALLTCFSGSALEAFELGTKVFIFGEEGKKIYSDYINKGLFFYLENQNELIKKMEELE
jgi:hypothetical protein